MKEIEKNIDNEDNVNNVNRFTSQCLDFCFINHPLCFISFWLCFMLFMSIWISESSK